MDGSNGRILLDIGCGDAGAEALPAAFAGWRRVRVDIDPNSDAMRFERVEQKGAQEPAAKPQAAESAASAAKSGRRR